MCIFFGTKCCAAKPDTLDCAIRKAGESARQVLRAGCHAPVAGPVMCGQGQFSNRGGYDPYNGAFVDLMALVVPEALPVIPGTSGPSTEPLSKGVSAAGVRWGRQLRKAATDCVYSVRGRLTVPPPDAPARSN